MKRSNEDSECAQRVVAFYANNSGVGKTTTVLTMAMRAAIAGKRVMVIDCDPQMKATRHCARWGFSDDDEVNAQLHTEKFGSRGCGKRQHFDWVGDAATMAAHHKTSLEYEPRNEESQRLLETYRLGAHNLLDLLMLRCEYDESGDSYSAALEALGEIGYGKFVDPHASFFDPNAMGRISVLAPHPMLATHSHELLFNKASAIRVGILFKHLLEKREFDLILLDLAPGASWLNQMLLANCPHFVTLLTGDLTSLIAARTLDLLLEHTKRNFLDRMPLKRAWNVWPRLATVVYTGADTSAVTHAQESWDMAVDKALAHKVTSYLQQEWRMAPFLWPKKNYTLDVPMIGDGTPVMKALQNKHQTPWDVGASDYPLGSREGALNKMLKAQYLSLWTELCNLLKLHDATLCKSLKTTEKSLDL